MADVPQVGDENSNGKGLPSLAALQEGLPLEEEDEVSSFAMLGEEDEGEDPEEGPGEDVPPYLQNNGPKPPSRISEEDRLRSENLHLKIMVEALKQKDLNNQMLNVQENIRGHQKEIMELRAELAQRYSIDFDRYDVQAETGQIIEKGQNANMAQVLQQLQRQQ